LNTSPRTRIKICGITRLEDAEAVADAGADALGLMFAEQSGRRVEQAMAARIAAAVAGRVARVGVFLDAAPDAVRTVLSRVDLDLLQFHGDEPAAYCESFALPYIKVHRVKGPVDVEALERDHPRACCHLLDTYVAGRAGGTGQAFDWALWPEAERCRLRLALAGGLNPENVTAAVTRTRPWAVDVSGGVEAGGPGLKDPNRIRRFVAAVRGIEAADEAESQHRR
jgi:phosphoribosylanthranilate isomerase